MDEMPFGLARQTTYAKLSPADLESMGKQAAIAYLSKAEPSLNDAVIKVAKCHPSISTHQVQRVIEFANQETFSRLFADNEKYASDKNIEFPLADPGHILHELNDGAKPQLLTPLPEEYVGGPIKTGAAASAVEADLALTRLFLGVDLASPNSEKTAAMIVRQNEDGTLGVVAGRILEAGEKGAGLQKRSRDPFEERVFADFHLQILVAQYPVRVFVFVVFNNQDGRMVRDPAFLYFPVEFSDGCF